MQCDNRQNAGPCLTHQEGTDENAIGKHLANVPEKLEMNNSSRSPQVKLERIGSSSCPDQSACVSRSRTRRGRFGPETTSSFRHIPNIASNDGPIGRPFGWRCI